MLSPEYQRVFQNLLLFLSSDHLRNADLSREEFAGLINGKDSKNTQLVTKTTLNTFKAFCGEKHPYKTQDFDEISKEEQNELFVDFYPNARKKTEGHYKK